MKEIKSAHIPESYQKIKHSSGVDILMYPMEGYNSAYALFSTKYGSIDTTFKTDGEADFAKVPEGIAHFLEHKLFESEKGDAFTRYAATGATANAYTSFDRTAYLFTCVDNFRDSFEILLDFVTDPYFTPETVEKEQGIISQEIKMYQDDADWRVFFGLLNCLYKENPVRIDIAGTVESIGEIDADLLYRCYNTFYNLHNMCIVVAGNFDPKDVIELADSILKPAENINIQRSIKEESDEVNESYKKINLPIAQPMFLAGYKAKSGTEEENFITSIKTEVLLDMVMGEASSLYTKMYEESLINATFSSSCEGGRGYLYSSFGGESRDPKKVQEMVDAEIEKFKAEGLSKTDFDHCKKGQWGRYIGIFGSVTSVGGVLLSSYFAGYDGFKVLDILANTTLEDLAEILNRDFNTNRKVLSVVEPS